MGYVQVRFLSGSRSDVGPLGPSARLSDVVARLRAESGHLPGMLRLLHRGLEVAADASVPAGAVLIEKQWVSGLAVPGAAEVAG